MIFIKLSNGEKGLLQSLLKLQDNLNSSKINVITLHKPIEVISFKESIDGEEYNGSLILQCSFHNTIDNFFKSSLKITDSNQNELSIFYYNALSLPRGEIQDYRFTQQATISYKMKDKQFNKEYNNFSTSDSFISTKIESDKCLQAQFELYSPTKWDSNYEEYHVMERGFSIDENSTGILDIQKELKQIQESKTNISRMGISSSILFPHENLLELASRLTGRIESLDSKGWQEIESLIRYSQLEYELRQYTIEELEGYIKWQKDKVKIKTPKY